MYRILMAFVCFFSLLFRGRLPARARKYLASDTEPPRLPETPEAKPAKTEPATPEPEEETATEPRAPGRPAKTTPKTAAASAHIDDGALVFLGLLQREGRLVDFLLEPIDQYEDADIGAAVRDIHRGCKKVLDEHMALEPVMPGDEDDAVTVPRGFDPGELRVIGEVSGEPPFQGVLRHHGWRAVKVSMPTLTEGIDRHVLAPAEVEVEVE